MKATRQDAARLLHEGAIAFAAVEHNGIRIDVPYLESAIEKAEKQVKELTELLRNDKIYSTWRRRFGDKTKLGSREQLGVVLFDVLKVKEGKYTDKSKNAKKKRYKVDEDVLEDLNIPFVDRFLELEKVKRFKNKDLKGVLNEVVNGFIHTSFNLNTVWTYRSSSNDPNFQNVPIRDPEVGEIVRTGFIPREGRILVEIDFKGAEVCVSACVNKDPNLIAYVSNPKSDMHRDVASQIFKLTKEQIAKAKPIRQEIKSNFVFAEFYGSWYKSCAPNIWAEMRKQKLTTSEGVSLFDHLAEQGITELGDCDKSSREDPEEGTFERRLWQVERDFWGRRFKVYDQWKRDYYDAYLRRGWFDMVTGFRCTGVYSKKQVCNAPIQGPSFHCLLWSIIRLQNWLEKWKMKTKIIGQIHDSVILDVVKGELMDVLHKVKRIITVELPKAWPWIIVPLTVEIEGSAENWFKKKQIEI